MNDAYELINAEFLEKAPTFDPRDDFSLCFYHVGEAEEGKTPKTELDIHGAVTLREIRELFAEFLSRYWPPPL